MIGGSDCQGVMADARQVKVMGDRDDAQSWFDVERISFVPCQIIIKKKHALLRSFEKYYKILLPGSF